MPISLIRSALTSAMICCVPALTCSVSAQQNKGEVIGILSGTLNALQGEFANDAWGVGGSVSLQYAPLRRLAIEGRFGLGEIRWKVTEANLATYPDYFGQGASYGDLYPGTAVPIEPTNDSRITTADVLLNYVLVPNLPAVPFISAGIGLINFSPSTDIQHEALPNNAAGVYSKSAFSIPIGGGVRIPFNDVSALILRAEHRFVFSGYLDDFNPSKSNDGLHTISIGLTYTFNPPARFNSADDAYEDVLLELFEQECDWADADGEDCFEEHCCDADCYDDAYCHKHELHRHCFHQSCCHHCCCCCCEKSAAAAPAAVTPPPTPEPPAPPPPPEPVPEQPSPPAPPAERKAFSKDIRFKLNTDEFDFTQPETEKNLEELLTYMKEAPKGHEVIIEGHASSEGPPQRNKVLSDLRAKKIRQWLIEQGVEQEKIRGTVGYGSSMPKVMEPSPQEAKRMTKEELESIRRQNRRIEVHVLKDAYAPQI
ncbi:MAG: OmpA family protein [Ignavibacteria bacterium]|nr:OmpA family protein [Ignavibacteria bacterium]